MTGCGTLFPSRSILSRKPPLGAESSIKVLHAARQDLEVLLPAVGAIGRVFDTQVAAALTGLPAQIGYGELTRRLLEVELAKGNIAVGIMVGALLLALALILMMAIGS